MATVEKKIGDTTYRVSMFGARRARSILFVLSKLIGGSLAALVGGSVTDALDAWGKSASREDFEFVCSALEDVTEYGETINDSGTIVWMPLKPQFDSHFSGKLDEMGLWLAFALESNFASFLSGKVASGFLQKLPAQKQPKQTAG